MSTNGKVNLLNHPVVNAKLSQLRQNGTTPKEFREVRYYAWAFSVWTILLSNLLHRA